MTTRGECYDSATQTYVKKGNTFQRRGKNNQPQNCTCQGQGQGRIDCVFSKGTCYDSGLQKWFNEGETWETEHPGTKQTMDCVCRDQDNTAVAVDCTTGNRCHDQGRSYKQGQQWTKDTVIIIIIIIY